MKPIISRVSTSNQIYLNPLQIIEITITDITVGATTDLKLFLGGVYLRYALHKLSFGT